MSNVIYPDFGAGPPHQFDWGQLQELLNDAFGHLLDEEEHEFGGDDILLAECLALTGAVLSVALSDSEDRFQKCYPVFLERLASAAFWSAGCCDDPTLATRLVEIARLAVDK